MPLAVVLLSITALSARADLSLTDNGLGVYDSALNATWTQDANLLGTLENTQGYSTIVNAIIAANSVIYDTPNFLDNGGSGIYNLSAADFGDSGKVNWWAAQAFVGYLNSLNNGTGYDGSNQWALPNSSQFSELLSNALGGTAASSNPANPFSNVQPTGYWGGTEYVEPNDALLSTTAGSQFYDYKGDQFLNYAWAVSAVPLPGAFWLFGAGMLGLLGLKRRGRAG